MTVSTTSSKQAAQTGDGSNKTFQYGFKILSASDLEVRIRTTSTGAETAPLTLTTDYTVTNVGQAGGGNVVFTSSFTAPTSGQQVFIKRVMDLTQTTDYVPNDPFPAASHEDALDKLTFIAQQQQEVFDRAIVLPETDTADTTLPNSVTRANKFLGFDANGAFTTLSSTGAGISSVDTGNIVDGAVTTAKLADSSVTSAKIVNATIATADMADDAITQAKIADDAVGQAQIADNAVGTSQIADSAVTAAKLAAGAAFLSGMLVPYAGTSLPSGWLFCDGSAVSRTTYADLFTAVGTTYGTGDGSTTFNLPDLRGRAIAGQDDMGGASANRLTNQTGGLNGDTLGATGGSETHTLTTAQMPSHTHSVSSVTVNGVSATGSGGAPWQGLVYSSGTNGAITNIATTYGVSSSNPHTASLANTGSGSAHNNVQPTIILNYIIKT